MPPARLKRFYKIAAAVKVDGGYHVALDGKPVRTPGGQTLLLTSKAMAEALAAEWQAQGDELQLARMGLHQLVCNALDCSAAERARLMDELAAYGETDLLCYRTDDPVALAARQKAAWDPLLDWAAEHYGARLHATSGIVAIAQDTGALAALRARILQADPLQLGALRAAAGIGGSLIVALAMAEGRLDAAQAWRVVNIDEDWQREKWGEDAQAAANRADAFRAFSHAANMLLLLRGLEAGPF